MEYSTDGGSIFAAINNWNSKGDSNHSLVDDWTSETITVTGLSGTVFQLRVTMSNNADDEKIGFDGIALTGVAEPQTLVSQGGFNNLNQLTSLSGGGKVLFSGTTDEPANVTVDGQNAAATDAGQTFYTDLDLPTGTQTVTVQATDVNNNTTNQDYSVVVEAGTARFLTYDANGNMTNNGDGQTYAWDAENRLIKITNGDKTSEFSYDGLGRRVRIVEKDNAVEISNSTFVWDGGQIVEKRNSAGTTWQRRYYHEGFIDTIVGDFFYTYDHLGSIREIIGDDGLSVEAQYDYNPWGVVTKIDGTGIESEFLYTGHWFHGGSELYLTYYRAYGTKLGRWLSRDPISEEGGMNLYAYVGNNSINHWDPLGLLAWGNWATVVDPELARNPDFYSRANTFDKNASIAGVALSVGVVGGVYLSTAAIAAGLGGGGFDLSLQLLLSGGDFKCVDFADVGISTIASASGYGFFANIGKVRKALRAKRILKKLGGKRVPEKTWSKYTKGLKKEALENENNIEKVLGAVGGTQLGKAVIEF